MNLVTSVWKTRGLGGMEVPQAYYDVDRMVRLMRRFQWMYFREHNHDDQGFDRASRERVATECWDLLMQDSYFDSLSLDMQVDLLNMARSKVGRVRNTYLTGSILLDNNQIDILDDDSRISVSCEGIEDQHGRTLGQTALDV